MSKLLEEWKPKLAELPQRDRAELAHFLLRTLHGKVDGGSDPWNDEIQQRLEEVVSGKAVGIPLEDVKADFRKGRS